MCRRRLVCYFISGTGEYTQEEGKRKDGRAENNKLNLYIQRGRKNLPPTTTSDDFESRSSEALSIYSAPGRQCGAKPSSTATQSLHSEWSIGQGIYYVDKEWMVVVKNGGDRIAI